MLMFVETKEQHKASSKAIK